MALFYLPALWWSVQYTDWNWLLQANGVFAVGGFVIFGVRKRFPEAAASALIIASVAGIGFVEMLALGMVGAGFWWMLQAATFVATSYSVRAGMAIAALCVLVMSIIGVGFISGHLGAGFDANEYIRGGSAWAGFLVVIAFAPMAILLVFNGQQHTIGKLVSEIDTQREALAGLISRDTLIGLPQATWRYTKRKKSGCGDWRLGLASLSTLAVTTATALA